MRGRGAGEALRAGERGEFVRHFAGDEIACTLGISLSRARDLLWLAERLATVMPCARQALGQARLDVGRVRVLAEATTVTNLDPKCRHHHQTQTLTLVRTALHASPGRGPRHTTWTLRAGATVTTRPEPLPGCDTGWA